MKKGKKGRRNRQGGMNTNTPASPPLMKSPTANPNSKPGAGYGKPLGGNKGNTTNPNATPLGGASKPRGLDEFYQMQADSFAGISPGSTQTTAVPSTSPTSNSLPMKSPTTNSRASAGAGYGRPIGTERSSLLGTKKDVLNSVKKKKAKQR